MTPEIPNCHCGKRGMYQNVYGSFCALHWDELWKRLTTERTKHG